MNNSKNAHPPRPQALSDECRAALLWLLWHHQGGNSAVGQPIRLMLGIAAEEALTDEQVTQAKSFAASMSRMAKDQCRGPSKERVREIAQKWAGSNFRIGAYEVEQAIRAALSEFATQPVSEETRAQVIESPSIRIDHGSISLGCGQETIQTFVDRMIAARVERERAQVIEECKQICQAQIDALYSQPPRAGRDVAANALQGCIDAMSRQLKGQAAERVAPARDDWIPVSERLPECSRAPDSHGVPVIVHQPGNEVRPVFEAFYGTRITSEPNFYLHGALLDGVSEWQPLPAPALSEGSKP